MNERIRELFGQALDQAVPYTWHNLDHVEVEKVAAKLAELIVLRCSELSDLAEKNCLHPGTIINRHFGVEL
jgi:hypothetical protein